MAMGNRDGPSHSTPPKMPTFFFSIFQPFSLFLSPSLSFSFFIFFIHPVIFSCRPLPSVGCSLFTLSLSLRLPVQQADRQTDRRTDSQADTPTRQHPSVIFIFQPVIRCLFLLRSSSGRQHHPSHQLLSFSFLLHISYQPFLSSLAPSTFFFLILFFYGRIIVFYPPFSSHHPSLVFVPFSVIFSLSAFACKCEHTVPVACKYMCMSVGVHTLPSHHHPFCMSYER